jgi:hypothetical protein
MRYDRIVIGYHGCDTETAQRLLYGDAFRPSENDYDWLGRGVYFWEFGPDRAYRFAEFQKSRGKIRAPAVVGALIQLGNCFDLLDTRFTQELREAYPAWKKVMRAAGAKLPSNGGSLPDRKLRRRDCAFLNNYLDRAAAQGRTYDTVRGGFTEGGRIYRTSGIQRETHIQIAVRSPDCILGVFRPANLFAP